MSVGVYLDLILKNQVRVDNFGNFFWHQPIRRCWSQLFVKFNSIHERFRRCAIATIESALKIALHRLVKIKSVAIIRSTSDTLSAHDDLAEPLKPFWGTGSGACHTFE